MSNNRVWFLGAPDPEMAAIEELLKECGEKVKYATINGQRASESFKCANCLAGSITQIYARLGDKYYTLVDDIFLFHNEIIKRINRENNK